MLFTLLPVLLADVGHAGPTGARPSGNGGKESAIDTYVCGQTNPSEYASFSLRFRTDASFDPDRPVSVTLVDRLTHTVSARTSDPARSPEHDLLDLDAWRIGRDDGGTVYLLMVPSGELEQALTVQVVQLLAAGRAQWVNEFGCTRR